MALKNLILKEATGKSTFKNGWRYVHILGVDCDCSKNVFNYLKSRSVGSKSHPVETVAIIGENHHWKNTLKKLGYFVVTGDAEEFGKKYLIKAVPQLTIFNEFHQIIYSGGYTQSRSISSVDQIETDLSKIKNELASQSKVNVYPIFGCITSKNLQRNFDPHGIKY